MTKGMVKNAKLDQLSQNGTNAYASSHHVKNSTINPSDHGGTFAVVPTPSHMVETQHTRRESVGSRRSARPQSSLRVARAEIFQPYPKF